MSQDKIVVFDDFSGGDEGRSRPTKTRPDTFRATNVWPYIAGIGPRPPVQKLRITGLPTAALGALVVLQSTPFTTPKLLMTFGTSIYRSVWGFDAAAASAGTVTNAPTAGCQIGPSVFFVATTGFGSQIADTGAPADVAAMPAGTIIRHADQTTVIRTPTDPIIRWSALLDPTTWPVANTLPIGAATPIMNILRQRNVFIVLKFEGTIWGITGTLGVNETLRQLDEIDALGISEPAVVNSSNLWYCGYHKMAYFTGAQAKSVERPDIPAISGYLTLPTQRNPGNVVPATGDDTFMVVGTADKTAATTTKTIWAHFHHETGAWTRHTLPVTEYPTTGLASSESSTEAVRTEHLNGLILIATRGNATTGPKLYQFDPQQEAPTMAVGTGYDSNLDADSGLPTVASFSTGELWSESGDQLAVTSVLVDYSYNPNITPLSTYARFDLSVTALQNAGSASTRTSTAQSFVAPASGSTPDGSPMVRGQARFQMGDQGSGVGFKINLTDWRGIIVHRITAKVVESPAQF